MVVRRVVRRVAKRSVSTPKPDLLDRIDYRNLNDNYEHIGCGIWPLPGLLHRVRQDGWVDGCHVVISYDDERFCKHKTGNTWSLVIKHWMTRWVVKDTGWGSSKRSRREISTRYRDTTKSFATRKEVIEFAEQVIPRITRAIQAREDSKYR